MKTQSQKMWSIVRKERKLRTLLLVGAICLAVAAVLGFMGHSRHQQEQKILSETQGNLQTYDKLQKIAEEEGKRAVQRGFFEKKSFASFEDVIPFIAYLEKLLSPIDPEAQITIKSPEGQIYLDHFADYAVHFKLIPGKKELLMKALEQLYDSRFIVKNLSFTMLYSPMEESEKNEFQEMLMSLRLYLK